MSQQRLESYIGAAEEVDPRCEGASDSHHPPDSVSEAGFSYVFLCLNFLCYKCTLCTVILYCDLCDAKCKIDHSLTPLWTIVGIIISDIIYVLELVKESK